MTPSLVKRLRELILGKDWQGLDRFPGWTMQGINPTVKIAGKFVAKDPEARKAAEVHPGTPLSAANTKPASTPQQNNRQGAGSGQYAQYIDLGPYTVSRSELIDLNKPSTLLGFTTEGIVSDLGAGVVRGDGPNEHLAPMHAESQRMADVLNRLSVNGADDAAEVKAELEGKTATTPEALIQTLIETGHTVSIADARYFANFGHFHFKGPEVMMPFWVDSQIAIPGEKRSLLVPVSHAEYEWTIRGPKINAQVSWYFGIDGKAEFRTMDTQDQAWVLGRHAHEYRDAQALEVTRLVGRMTVAYLHQHLKRPDLPFGGYYPLGVCQDGVAAIERKMTGQDTLFPNTADASLFDDPRDAEINALMAAIPKDREGGKPDVARIFGSIPADNFEAITIPGLAADLTAVHTAWQDGSLERTSTWMHRMAARVAGIAAIGLVGLVVLWRKRRRA
jgi:hypothetical protein